jgi:integrase
LKWAVRQGYINRNPAELTDPPKPQHRTMNTLSEFEAAALLDKARSSFCYPVIYTAISTGLRRNELLGLRWRDIDLLMATISVSQVLYKGRGKVEFKEPKTEYSRRQVSMTPKLALYLGAYKRDREQFFIERGRPITLDDLVFTNDDGGPVDPSTVSHNFGRICRSMGLNIRFHDLRHTCASLMLRQGVHPKIVSEMLGHSTVAITLDVYSHVTPGLQEAAARSLDALLPAGLVQGHGVNI